MDRPNLHHIAEQALNRPLLIHPDKARVVLDVLAGRLPGVAADQSAPAAVDPLPDPSPQSSAFVGRYQRPDGSYGLSRSENGIAIIRVVGSLVNRGAWLDANSGLVSYEGIAAQVREARDDPNILGVVLDINSGGGEALGMDTLAALIRETDQIKPVIASVNDMACSAAYGIASGCRQIIGSRTSMVGSIGVVLMHADFSAHLEDDGINVSFIHAGAHKVDGNPYQPLPDSVRADFQSEIDQFWNLFLETVEAGRGSRLTAEMARALEARVFTGADALDQGLIDDIGDLDMAMALAAGNGPAGASITGGPTMANDPKNQPTATFTAADMSAEYARGTSDATARIAAILSCDAADGRMDQAKAIAFETDMTAEAAAKVLAAGPKETPVAETASDDKPKSIAERAAEQEQIGGSPAADTSKADPFAKSLGRLKAKA